MISIENNSCNDNDYFADENRAAIKFERLEYSRAAVGSVKVIFKGVYLGCLSRHVDSRKWVARLSDSWFFTKKFDSHHEAAAALILVRQGHIKLEEMHEMTEGFDFDRYPDTDIVAMNSYLMAL